MKSCFAIAWCEIWWNPVFAKLRSNVHQDCGTEALQHAQINKGWLLDISLLLGLYAGLIIDALHFILPSIGGRDIDFLVATTWFWDISPHPFASICFGSTFDGHKM